LRTLKRRDEVEWKEGKNIPLVECNLKKVVEHPLFAIQFSVLDILKKINGI
jgi:hypothetical protein